MLAPGLRAVRRQRPDLLVEIDFGPPHPENFPGARGGQDTKLYCLSGGRPAFPQAAYKSRNILVSHRVVMTAREF